MNTLICWPVWRLMLAVGLSIIWGGFAWDLILTIHQVILDRRELEGIEELAEMEHDSCDGCKWDLGGGCCSLNVEDECAAGGGYELWEGEEDV